MTTNVTAGPSGVAGARCTVDGGASGFYPGATAEVPVSGLGAHVVTCIGENNAVGPGGQPGTSAPQTFDMTIRQATASAITFARIADALRCHTITEVKKVRGRLHIVRRHGKRIRVRGPARKVRRRVRKCHARTVVRIVRVILKRHGRPVLRHGKPVYVKRRVRRVLLPHAVYKPTRRVGHGKRTTVNGFVVLADGTALAGQPVDVYSSPADNAPRFHLMRVVHDGRGRGVDRQGGGRPVSSDRGRLPRQRHHRAGQLVHGQAHRAGEDRHVDLTARGPMVGQDHHQRAAGRRMGTGRRGRPAAAGSVPRWSDPSGTVSHHPQRPVSVSLDLPVRSRRGALPLRGRDHVHRVGLPVGGGDEQPRRGHLRATDAPDPPRSASPGRRSMSARARGEHDWPRTTGWRPVRPVTSRTAPAAPRSGEAACGAAGDVVDVDHPRRSPRTRRVWLAVAVLAAAAIAIASSSPGRPARRTTGVASRGHASGVV